MAESPVVQLRVPQEVLDRIELARGEETRSAWIMSAIDFALELEDGGAPAPADGARSLGPGIPAPGVMCLWPRCESRDSDRYGVTDAGELERTDYLERPRDESKVGIALCKAHAAILEGREYRRPLRDLPPSWSHKVQRGVPEPA